MLKGSPMPAQLLTIPLERISTRQCVLPRSGFVLGSIAAEPPPEAEVRVVQHRTESAGWLAGATGFAAKRGVASRGIVGRAP